MDQKINQAKIQQLHCVLLAAGYGSRISNVTQKPKCLLELEGQTLLERNLFTWKNLGIKNVTLVLGYEHEAIVKVAEKYDNFFTFHYRLNEDFRRLGNTHSLYLGVREINGPCLIFDADLAYDPAILKKFMESTLDVSSILIGEADINDIECAKALVDNQGFVRKTVDKRAITPEELRQYKFAGEAIGILKFSKEHTQGLAKKAEEFLSHEQNQGLNWEHLLNQFLPQVNVTTSLTTDKNWVEIDNAEDFARAKKIFQGRRV